MKNVSVAIIDNGVNENRMLNFNIIEHYHIEDNQVVNSTKFETETITHGTVCAIVLSQYTNDIDLTDIKIFDSDRASINHMIVALEWCYDQSISIINMSFGTLNFLDYKKMEPIINKLLNKGTFLVAAFHNYNIKSFPAVHERVFGVRRDEGNRLKSREFGFQSQEGLAIENCLVAHMDYDYELLPEFLTNGNSFAAPVITSHISDCLKRYPKADFQKVLEYMKSNEVPDGYLGRDIKEKVMGADILLVTPSLAFFSKDKDLFLDLRRLFINNGYISLSITDQGNVDNSIPYEFYCSKEEGISKDFFMTMEFVYNVDLFLLFLDKDKYHLSDTNELIDLYIFKEEGKYCIRFCDNFHKCDSLKEVYVFIVTFFERDEYDGK